ncbi:hypothetical protein AN639_03620 [Candidatus Epulonipiscium fishelsonii]|uniref:Uncharacterized protein n=1 Tax=Candidatus Epulonipiscium fishelsonii TaxID=77094 RepID=A0ACC8XDG2_9FIRM|nr:hypothetical protein AN396_00745 [Epulopiscium sp. SCG-B11WGA-EpuloA1]ONI41507.1 hypothetical protein AN639_03620 [Epulopiscium sp. SCG-B05WGA-EpuloA1]
MDLVMRNILVMPGNNPSMLLKAPCFNADGYIFDLEDAVFLKEKDAARRLVVKHVNKLGYKGCNICVRVNNEKGLLEKDIEAIANLDILAVIVPKCENAQIIQYVESLLDKYTINKEKKLKIMPVIESGKGVFNIQEIVGASQNIIVVHFGAGDYSSSIGANITKIGNELLFARSMIINACSIHNILAMDTPCLDLENEEVLRTEAENSRNLGFSGKIVINPRQIEIVNKVFTPSEKEIEFAKKIIKALDEASSGVISVDGKMIDIAITKKAEKILAIAKRIGVL